MRSSSVPVRLLAPPALLVPVLHEAAGAVHQGPDSAQGCHEKAGGGEQEREDHPRTGKSSDNAGLNGVLKDSI